MRSSSFASRSSGVGRTGGAAAPMRFGRPPHADAGRAPAQGDQQGRSPDASSSVVPRLERLSEWLPLPRRSDWRAEDGWVPAGLLLVTLGATAIVLLSWARVDPAGAPLAGRLLPADGLLSVLSLGVGGALALRPGGQAPVWRWLTILAVASGAVFCDPQGLRMRYGFPFLVTTALLALCVRAGETLAGALARPLHDRALRNPLVGAESAVMRLVSGTNAPVVLEELDVTTGQSPLWTTWRLVSEFWVLSALMGAAFGLPAGPSWRLAAAATAVGGALLVVGAALATLQASWKARGFAFDAGQSPPFWGLGLGFAAVLGLLALLLPVPPAPFSERLLAGVLRGVGRAHLPFTSVAAASAGPHTAHGMALAGLVMAPAALLAALVREMWFYFGLWLAYPLALPIILPMAAAAALLLLRALRRPAVRDLWRRLLTAVLSALAFWRYLRLPRRMRRLLEGMGLLRPEPAAPEGTPSLLLRLWALADPRAAVRHTYRRFLRTMSAAGAARPAGHSARAFEAAVRARELAGPGVAELTQAYELARYSGHRPERSWAERARRGLAAVTRRITGRGERQRHRAIRRRPS